MNSPTEKDSYTTIGTLIKALREERGLTPEALAGLEFSTDYVSALEIGAVQPSLKVLEVLAIRLGVPVADFVSASQRLSTEPDLKAVEEDIVYQANYAKMLIRTKQAKEALTLIADIEESARPYEASLSAGVAYLLPYMRGRAYIELQAPARARSELEVALKIATPDPEAVARTRNLLGTVDFLDSQPGSALRHHLLCLKSIKAHEINDLNFRINVYGNIATDYWGLNKPRRAIGIYKEMIPFLEDLNDKDYQARVCWGMTLAYMALNDWPHARLCATKALNIYETMGRKVEAASICLNLAETLTEDGRFKESNEVLERAESLLSGTGNQVIASFLHRAYADLARREGQYEKSYWHADQSIELAQAYQNARLSGEEPENDSGWQFPNRIYAEALQTKALIEEDQGNREAADDLFEQALALLEEAGLEETRYEINMSYAKVLEARGDFEKAVKFYHVAAELHTRGGS